MHMNMLPLWICSSILFQEAFGAASAVSDPSLSPHTSSTVSDRTRASSVLEQNIDWVLSEFEGSLDKTKSAQLKATLQNILHQYDQRVEELEHTLATYDEAAKEAMTVLDQISTELMACRAQEGQPEPDRQKMQQKTFGRNPIEKRYDQLYLSYLALKPQFKDALNVLQTRFPGFKYNPKKIASLAGQFESWAKANPNSAAASPPATPAKS